MVGQANLNLPKPATIQTMVNSPGGIQSFGSVTVASDRRLISSLLLKVVMDLETSELPVTRPGDLRPGVLAAEDVLLSLSTRGMPDIAPPMAERALRTALVPEIRPWASVPTLRVSR